MMEQWDSGTYRLREMSKEFWLEHLRRLWEFRQNLRQDDRPTEQNLLIGATSPEPGEQLAFASYSEYELGSQKTIFFQTGGKLNLENVSSDHAEGSFTVDVIGLPMEEIFFADEFPEEPEVQSYHITGNFVAVYGDYHDFIQASQ